MTTPTRANYRPREVRAWVEKYEELREKRDTTPREGRLHALLCLLDIERAVKSLGPKEYQAVLLCGQIGLTVHVAGALMGVSGMTMSRRYRAGLEQLTDYLNGATIE